MFVHARSLLGFSTALVGVMAAMPAYAQDSNGDIIVTARRTEERLQDVPISITVFNQTQLSKSNIVNSQDLARITPSLSANSNYGSENSSFAIRGFVQDAGTAPSVGVYFADVVAPRGASNNIPVGDGAGPGSFFDLQNVQVLKGPQGTLQGRNTTGGAVLLVPQKPTGKFEGYIEGSIGNYDMRRIQAVVNVPVNDSLRIRLGVDRQTRDGYLHNTSGIGPSNFNDIDYTVFRASVVADLAPNLENYAIFNYSNSASTGSVQKMIAAGPTEGLLGSLATAQLAAQKAAGDGFYDIRQDTTNPMSKLEQWQVINTTTWRASDTLTLKNIISYAQLKDYLRNPLFGSAFAANPASSGAQLPIVSSVIYPPPNGYTGNESTFTEEFQIQGRTANDALTYQGGAYLEVANPLGDAGSLSPVFSNCSDPANKICSDPLGGEFGFPLGALNYTAARTAYRDVGLYAQATYKLNSVFKITGGFRYTWDREISDQQLINYGGFSTTTQSPPSSITCTNPLGFNALNPDGTTKQLVGSFNVSTDCRYELVQRSQKPTWLIDLDYTPTEDILLYAKYARGYRAGTLSPAVTAPFNVIGPESVDSYEVGAKTSWHGAVRGTLNVAAFYNKFSNQQLQLGFNTAPGASVSPTSSPFNAGKSRIWGVEVEGSIQPFKGLDISGGYTHLDTKIQAISIPQVNTFPYVLSGAQEPGDPLALTPRNKYTITGTYTLPLDESIGRISGSATFTHTDSMLANYADRTDPNPAFAALSYLQPTDLLNASVSWNEIMGTGVDLTFFATNVTKQKYYAFIPGLLSGFGFETAAVAEPRMYGVRLKYHFGS